MNGNATPFLSTAYTRSATGRVASTMTETASGSFDYTYDYAGRLRSATSSTGVAGYTQTFVYNRAGSFTSNSRVGTYAYGTARPRHAPVTVTKGGVVTTFTYDANGNMTAGLDGKVMAYDGENRPLSVTFGGVKTCYVYGADGSRLKKIEGLAPAANCPTAPSGAGVTAYFANVEIRNYGQGSTTEQIITYPAPAIRLVNGVSSVLHRDQLGSVRGLTGAAGTKAELSTYRPFGEQDEVQTGSPVNETKGFIGERYDADAGLQYLNARYYDPKLAMFAQPDWFEVMQPGVGTNRFAYAGNDPVNLSDQGGNCTTSATCSGDWDDEVSEKAGDRQSEDGVADASIYEKKNRYVLDPKSLKLDELMDLGEAIQRYVNSGTPAYQKSDLKRAIDRATATGLAAEFEIDGLGSGLVLAS